MTRLTHIALRIDPELLTEARAVAEREDRSLSYIIRRALEREVARAKRANQGRKSRQK